MKNYVIALICAAMTLVCGCGKDGSGDKHTICQEDKLTWAALVREYPFLDGFPVFDGEVENNQYRVIGSSTKTVTFFDYKCEETVATTYYAKFIPAGFTKSEGGEIYRKTANETVYMFSGGYSGGNFALSFSVEPR